jgi:predicted branched-subunit amino acid permease
MAATATTTQMRPGTSAGRAIGGGRAAMAGMRAMLPLLAAVAPYGLVVGAAASESDLDPAAGFSTSWLLYGGTAQLVAIRLLDAGAAAVVVVATILMVNTRLFFYGAELAPHWAGSSRAWRVLATYLIVDPSYLVAIEHNASQPDRRAQRHFYMGAAGLLWIGWLAANGTGLLVGERVAGLFPIEVLMPLMLTAMLAPKLRERPAVVAAATAATVAVPATLLPMESGLVVAGIAGIAAGVGSERWTA